MNAIEILKHDHNTVQKLLKDLTGSTERAEKKRTELLQKIEHELSVHTRLEEEIFYPAFKEADDKSHKTMFFEAMEEHRAVEKLVLPDLMKTDPTSEQFLGRAKVLQEMIEHHISEEEKEMFPEAEKTLGNEQLEEIGKQMASRKKELQ